MGITHENRTKKHYLKTLKREISGYL